MKRVVRYVIVFLMYLVVAGCQDEFLGGMFIGEGEASVSATLDFKPMSSALENTRTAGNVLKDISSLHVLLYDYETLELLNSWKVEDYDVSDEERTDAEAENGTSAEAETRRATFKLPEKIDFGRYYMYAVANIPDLLENYSDAIQTVDGLKKLPLTWDAENMADNGQMIGCLTNTSILSIDDVPLVVNEKSPKLHAWLRRAASKVTVAFDGSSLKEGVSIYIKSLRIRNIPVSCSLGTNNTVKDTTGLIKKGEEVIYSTSSNYDASYPALITKDLPYYPRVLKTEEGGNVSWEKDPDAHSETNPNSLFFYENMQGTGPDKRQFDNNKDGKLDEIYPYKEKLCATYIEVEAYYESTNPERPGMCNIFYRFMLGQNISTDYNAKRNCHYKLTLHFNGYADDPDWRIDYVTRFGASQPAAVDYRGMYFVPDNATSNQGNNFSDNNVITVTSFRYSSDSWEARNPVGYKIEYRDSGSIAFTEKCPDWLWLDEVTKTEDKEKGVHEWKINYKNPYTSQNINKTLSDNDTKEGVYDLATKGGKEKMNTANCYIVDSKGTYMFPLVYGNAMTDGKKDSTSYTYQAWGTGDHYLKEFKNYLNRPIRNAYILDDIYGVGKVPAVELKPYLVWQDEPNLIGKIEYVPDAYDKKGGIRFSIGSIKEGNAVIAIKDPNEVMWSWHIWVTAIDFSKKIILTNYHPDKHTSQDFEIMPVNLGWCSGDVPIRYYDRHACEVRFTQLISAEGQEGMSKTVKIIQEPHIAVPRGNNPYYQWGRKDPFVAGDGNESDESKHTKKWYNVQNPTGSTASPSLMYTALDDADRVETYKATAELIKKPDQWQNCPRQTPGDWGNKFKPKDNIFYNLWDNSCWDGDDEVVKTVYDPCPAGYHVSSLYTFSGFTDFGGSIADGVEVGGVTVDIKDRMYAATEDNMMPKDKNNTSDESYKKYRDGIFEFYTNKTKLISIGFPLNGYRDWDANAYLLTFGTHGQVWHAQAAIWSGATYNAYHFEYQRFNHIYPWNNFYSTDGFPVRPTITLKKKKAGK